MLPLDFKKSCLPKDVFHSVLPFFNNLGTIVLGLPNSLECLHVDILRLSQKFIYAASVVSADTCDRTEIISFTRFQEQHFYGMVILKSFMCKLQKVGSKYFRGLCTFKITFHCEINRKREIKYHVLKSIIATSGELRWHVWKLSEQMKNLYVIHV